MKNLRPILLFAACSCFVFPETVVPQAAHETRLDPSIYNVYLTAVRGTSRNETEGGKHLDRGPSLLIDTPVETEITFMKNNQGHVPELLIRKAEITETKASRINLYKEEDVRFHNGEIQLAGTLLVPTAKGPHPAIVVLNGSGPQDRNGYVSLIRLTADYFARNGFATLIYDKRGVGTSTGN